MITSLRMCARYNKQNDYIALIKCEMFMKQIDIFKYKYGMLKQIYNIFSKLYYMYAKHLALNLKQYFATFDFCLVRASTCFYQWGPPTSLFF